MKTPQLAERDIRSILTANRVDPDFVSVLAIRGYLLDSKGKPGENDRRFYDDAHFIVWPDGIARFFGNTDPNGWRKGKGFGVGKGMACLDPGIWRYGTGKHKGKPAFRPCEPFTVTRDGDPPYKDTGHHATNWHMGSGDIESVGRTSSEGCQTSPPREWGVLRPLLYALLDKYDNPVRANDWGELVPSFDYLLIEETERRKNNLVISNRYF